MSWLFLVALTVALVCMVALDHRFRLFLFSSPWRGAVVLTVGAAVFLGWDLVAIGQGFYARGQSPAMTGIELAPHLPLEELFFILFLCYLTMVLYGLAPGLHRARRRRWYAVGLVGALLVVLTVVFDSLMIAADLFRYDDAALLGPRLWLAPVEDLAWPVAATLLLPAVWELLGRLGRASAGDAASSATPTLDRPAPVHHRSDPEEPR